MSTNSPSVTVVTGLPLIGVTRAYTRASTADNGDAVTTVTTRHPNLTVLALDLGTTTGWALRSMGMITSGCLSLKSSRFDGGGMRYLRFRRWLEQLQSDAGPIGAVYFEEVRRHVGTDAAHVYGGLLGQLTAWCEEHGIAYQGVPVGTIKAFAAGRGNADKAAMIAAVQARGFSPADDNEADAIAILLWAIETGGGVR
jgi:Holliday junction resolvasome RuvABC endonuclease subunit